MILRGIVKNLKVRRLLQSYAERIFINQVMLEKELIMWYGTDWREVFDMKASTVEKIVGGIIRKERMELLNYYEFQVNFNNSTATISIPSNETITRNDLKHFTTNTNTTYSMPTYLPSSTTSTSINPIIKNNIIRSKRILSEIIKKVS